MTGNALLDLVALPIGFGLFGFIEPCSIGSTLIFVEVMEGKSAAGKIARQRFLPGCEQHSAVLFAPARRALDWLAALA